MKQLQIIYDKKKCIAAGLCESIDPEHFVLNGDKADLIGGKPSKKDIFLLEFTPINEKQNKQVIEAAMSCPINAISVKDMATNSFIVSPNITENTQKEITATYYEANEWKMDPRGYFLIRTDVKKKIIEVGHCMERNIVDIKITGKNATETFNTIIRENLISSMQHAAYLGKELYKAELALKYKSKYVQDKDIKLKRKTKTF